MSPTDLLRAPLSILSASPYLPIYGHRLKIINMAVSGGGKNILCAYKWIGLESEEQQMSHFSSAGRY